MSVTIIPLEEGWATLDAGLRRAEATIFVQNVPTAHWWAQKKRKRTVACGKCDACCRDDCGRCLNCCDKPKFGGPGARRNSPPASKLPQKKAMVARAHVTHA